jgi:death-on-curing protein
MTCYLTVEDVEDLHRYAIQAFGGSFGLRDRGLLESAVAAPRMTWGGVDLLLTLPEKAAALAYSLAKNHAFVDGNKRVALAALDTFLRQNGQQLTGTQLERERALLAVADGTMDRDGLAQWVSSHCGPLPPRVASPDKPEG